MFAGELEEIALLPTDIQFRTRLSHIFPPATVEASWFNQELRFFFFYENITKFFRDSLRYPTQIPPVIERSSSTTYSGVLTLFPLVGYL